MKKNIFLLLFVVVFGGCQKEPLFDKYATLVYRDYFEIPAGVGVFDVYHFYINNVDSKYFSSLQNANIKPEEVTKVLLNQGAISSTFGDADLSFIDKVSIRAFADGDPTNYLEIGYRDPSPVDPGNGIGLIPSLASVQEFFAADKINLDVVLWMRKTTTENVPMQLDLTVWAGY